jgi:hypothetical protein
MSSPTRAELLDGGAVAASSIAESALLHEGRAMAFNATVSIDGERAKIDIRHQDGGKDTFYARQTISAGGEGEKGVSIGTNITLEDSQGNVIEKSNLKINAPWSALVRTPDSISADGSAMNRYGLSNFHIDETGIRGDNPQTKGTISDSNGVLQNHVLTNEVLSNGKKNRVSDTVYTGPNQEPVGSMHVESVRKEGETLELSLKTKARN